MSVNMNRSSGPTNRSIWQGIARKDFEANIDRLAKLNYVPGARDYTLKQQAGCSISTDSLEQKLADDFAFISAYEVGVGYVTVATVQLLEDEPSILTLAANEGIQPCVGKAISDVLSKMEQHSAKGIAWSHITTFVADILALRRRDCEQAILDIIVKLNWNKILGRLSSKHFNRPGYYRKERRAVHLELQDIVDNRPSTTPRMRVEFSELQRDVSQFRSACLRLEESNDENLVKDAEETIKVAYQLRGGASAFYHRVTRLHLPHSHYNARAIREIDKLGNYWRIARDLTKVSRHGRHQSFARRMALEKVPNCGPIPSSKRGIDHYVHAEIQMVMHYEAQPSRKWPRMIGSSKEACFLCDAFITAHGMFNVSKAHRQVVNKWTVPDMQDLEPDAIQRISEALTRINQLVREVTIKASAKSRYLPYPLQSSTNVHMLPLPSPTESTVTTIRLETSGSAVPISKLIEPKDLVVQVDAEPSNSNTPTSGINEQKESVHHREHTETSAMSATEPILSTLISSATKAEDSETRNLVQEIPKIEGEGSTESSGCDESRLFLPGTRGGTRSPHERSIPSSPRSEILKVVNDSENGQRHDSLIPTEEDKDIRAVQSLEDSQRHAEIEHRDTCDKTLLKDETLNERVTTVTSGVQKLLEIGHYHLNVHLEDSDPFDGPYTSGSVRAAVVRQGAIDGLPDVLLLKRGECRVLDIGDGTGERDVQFVLKADRYETVRLSCSWAE